MFDIHYFIGLGSDSFLDCFSLSFAFRYYYYFFKFIYASLPWSAELKVGSRALWAVHLPSWCCREYCLVHFTEYVCNRVKFSLFYDQGSYQYMFLLFTLSAWLSIYLDRFYLVIVILSVVCGRGLAITYNSTSNLGTVCGTE